MGMHFLELVLCVLAGSLFSDAQMVARAAACQAPMHIKVASEVRIPSEEILLRDIATMQCDLSLSARLGELKLAAAPRPGKKKTFSGKWIVSRIRSEKWISEDIRIDVPARVTVIRSFQTLAEECLERLFAEYVQAILPNADTAVRQFKVRGLGPLPLGKVHLTTEPRNDRDSIGRVSLKVGVAVDGQSQGKLFLSGWVDRYERIVCARRFLTRDTVLRAEDLCLQRQNISRMPSNLVCAIDLAIGKRLKQTIKSGACLRENMLEKPPLIFKGDRVKLIARKGALKVEMLGIARERGARGDQLRVENLSSGKTVIGEVVDAATVKVFF